MQPDSLSDGIDAGSDSIVTVIYRCPVATMADQSFDRVTHIHTGSKSVRRNDRQGIGDQTSAGT